jgi:hypothetical protein
MDLFAAFVVPVKEPYGLAPLTMFALGSKGGLLIGGLRRPRVKKVTRRALSKHKRPEKNAEGPSLPFNSLLSAACKF